MNRARSSRLKGMQGVNLIIGGGSPGIVVKGKDSCSKGRGFES